MSSVRRSLWGVVDSEIPQGGDGIGDELLLRMPRIADCVDVSRRSGIRQWHDSHSRRQRVDAEPGKDRHTESATDHVQGRREGMRLMLEVDPYAGSRTCVEENRSAGSVADVIVDPLQLFELSERDRVGRGDPMVVGNSDDIRVCDEQVAVDLDGKAQFLRLRDDQLNIGAQLPPRSFREIELNGGIRVAVLEVGDELRQPSRPSRREVPDRQPVHTALLQFGDPLLQSTR
ncbi:hypothetical protein B8X04_01925 [Brevibacterium casei]|uniref:Uncharacterized protein n=1 Tax=Brevibacterium casei TaxID=33889 RepID=A0A269ZFU9_9MICO|nr:hypothetical protein B8X04_01925 [Brevibacterium casei]